MRLQKNCFFGYIIRTSPTKTVLRNQNQLKKIYLKNLYIQGKYLTVLDGPRWLDRGRHHGTCDNENRGPGWTAEDRHAFLQGRRPVSELSSELRPSYRGPSSPISSPRATSLLTLLFVRRTPWSISILSIFGTTNPKLSLEEQETV